ncbi:MAG: DUF2029 domain-containing protein [Anaerolineae bacterium]|nr:DUF2029 domain-containing protein [Anaerolineae bacterium]
MTSRTRQLLTAALLAALLLALFAGMAAFSLNAIVLPRGQSFDFYPRYVGSQAFWNGESPYSAEVSARIQTGMWNYTLPPEGYDQQRFVYPAYTALVIAPLLVLPVHTAIAIWMSAQYLAVLASIGIWLALLSWRIPGWGLFILLLGFGFAFRYPIDMYMVAQFTGTMLLLISLALLLLARNHDGAAGVLLALATIPPTIAAPLALVLLGSYALHGRWRGLIGFAGALLVLGIVTFVRIGWWIPGFLDGLSAYPGYAHPVWAPGLIDLPLLRVVLVGSVAAVVVKSAFRLMPRRPLDFAAIAITGTLLLVPQTGSYYLVLLIPPLLVAAHRALSLSLLPRCAIWGACAAAVVSPWLYRTMPIPQIENLALPLHVGLIWLSLIYAGLRNDPARVA